MTYLLVSGPFNYLMLGVIAVNLQKKKLNHRHKDTKNETKMYKCAKVILFALIIKIVFVPLCLRGEHWWV